MNQCNLYCIKSNLKYIRLIRNYSGVYHERFTMSLLYLLLYVIISEPESFSFCFICMFRAPDKNAF